MSELDLTPRTGPDADGPAAPRGARSSKAVVVAVVVVLLGAGAFLVTKALDEATLFFYTVPEAVERRDELGGDRFRVEGLVVPGSVESFAGGATFALWGDGVEIEVRHDGDPANLFQEAIPVVLEGRWEGVVFASDRMLVSHDESYEEGNPERLAEAREQLAELEASRADADDAAESTDP